MAKSKYEVTRIFSNSVNEFVKEVNHRLKSGWSFETSTLNSSPNFYEVYMITDKTYSKSDPDAPQIGYIEAKNPKEFVSKLMKAVDNGASLLCGFRHEPFFGRPFSLFIFITLNTNEDRSPRLEVVQDLHGLPEKVKGLMNKGYVMTPHFDHENQAVIMYKLPKKIEHNGAVIEMVPEK